MRTRQPVATVAAVCFWTAVAHAVPTLDIRPASGVNLGNLQVGQPLSIEVVLSGLDAAGGQQLETLATSVLFDSTLFGTPTAVDAGPIVADAADFASAAFPGLADGFFFQTSGPPISTNGVFYSFDLMARSSGVGDLALDPLGLTAVEVGSTIFIAPGAAPPLPVIVQPPTVIPLPAAAWMGIGLLSGAGALQFIRRTYQGRTGQ